MILLRPKVCLYTVPEYRYLSISPIVRSHLILTLKKLKANYVLPPPPP